MRFFVARIAISLALFISPFAHSAQSNDDTSRIKNVSRHLTKSVIYSYPDEKLNTNAESPTSFLVQLRNVKIEPQRVSNSGEAKTGADTGEIDTLINKEVLARIKVRESITPETTELLGDSIGLSVGSVSFSHTDISIPGNSSLEVAIRRTFKGSNFAFTSRLDMADWALDLPYIHTTLLSNYNRTTKVTRYSGSWGNGQECSGGLNPDFFLGFEPSEFWNGDTLNIPGLINEKLLSNNGTLASRRAYSRVTQSNYKVACSAREDGLGEKFIVSAPNGKTYTFAQLRLVGTSPLSKRKGDYKRRFQAFMMVTKIEDHLGNFVDYIYNDNGQLRLIQSKDGRQIEITYNHSNHFYIDKITANGRSWQYDYDEDSLINVTRPDGKQWSIDLARFGKYTAQMHPGDSEMDGCTAAKHGENFIGTITHPNGTTGKFQIDGTRFGRGKVHRIYDPRKQKDYIRRCFAAASLVKKTLIIPGVAKELVWNYDYSELVGAGQVVMVKQ